MAVLDTHKAFEHLTAAGYSKEMAEALLDTLGNSQDTLATKADLNELAQMTKADLNELAQMTKADLNELAQTTKADLSELAQTTKADLSELAQTTKADLNELAQTTKVELRELELRMTIKVGAMLFAVAGLLVALELIPR